MMNELEINANNKLIAEFMGNLKIYQVLANPDAELKKWFFDNHGTVSLERANLILEDKIKEYPNAIVVIDLNQVYFHTSWDWLMPVVALITDMANGVDDDDDIYNSDHYTSIRDTLSGANIEDVYKVVVEFIKWYNE